MSFSGTVKNEISTHISNARHCQLAELAAIIQSLGRIVTSADGKSELIIDTDNNIISQKCFTLLKKTFNIVSLTDQDDVWNILEALKLIDKDGVFRGLNRPISPLLIKNACCKRAYLRGMYMCIGSMSDPNKGYHLELVCGSEPIAEQIIEIMSDFGLEAKMVTRKKYFVVYIKEGSAIVDFLNICEAHVALMKFENLRIVKEMRNSINRRVNCEAANITKTVNAATKQIEDIEYLRDHYGFGNLPGNLREMAEVRLEHPDATLSELGGYLDPPVGKSGVNHRLRRLSEIASQV